MNGGPSFLHESGTTKNAMEPSILQPRSLLFYLQTKSFRWRSHLNSRATNRSQGELIDHDLGFQDSGSHVTMKQAGKLPLTEDCNHWTRLGEVPWDLQKSVFSCYGQHVLYTD